jgi:hypothetical protein
MQIFSTKTAGAIFSAAAMGLTGCATYNENTPPTIAKHIVACVDAKPCAKEDMIDVGLEVPATVTQRGTRIFTVQNQGIVAGESGASAFGQTVAPITGAAATVGAAVIYTRGIKDAANVSANAQVTSTGIAAAATTTAATTAAGAAGSSQTINVTGSTLTNTNTLKGGSTTVTATGGKGGSSSAVASPKTDVNVSTSSNSSATAPSAPSKPSEPSKPSGKDDNGGYHMAPKP